MKQATSLTQTSFHKSRKYAATSRNWKQLLNLEFCRFCFIFWSFLLFRFEIWISNFRLLINVRVRVSELRVNGMGVNEWGMKNVLRVVLYNRISLHLSVILLFFFNPSFFCCYPFFLNTRHVHFLLQKQSFYPSSQKVPTITKLFPS